MKLTCVLLDESVKEKAAAWRTWKRHRGVSITLEETFQFVKEKKNMPKILTTKPNLFQMFTKYALNYRDEQVYTFDQLDSLKI